MQGNFTFYILIALVVGYLAYYFIWRQKEAKKLQEWLDQHPNAVKVYTKGKISLIGSGTLTIIDVDGEQPKQFTEGLKGGFYVLPGTHVVGIQERNDNLRCYQARNRSRSWENIPLLL